MEKAMLVGVGGFLGSVSRYALGGWVQAMLPGASFPVGTLSVNLIGSLVLGLLGAGAEMRGFFTPETRALIFIGVLGGFTTFSTFAYETLALGRDGEPWRAASNVLISVAGCLLAVWIGAGVGRLLWRLA